MATVPDHSVSSAEPQPAWDVALLFPCQGDWSENDYLNLDTNRLVELIDGNLEVLPVPTFLHQLIVEYLFDALRDFVRSRNLGKVIFAPFPIHIRAKTFREPDVAFFSKDTKLRPIDKHATQASLVVEVVSPDNKSHKRDYQEKRADYAELSIPEYWIVDPQTETIMVLVLKAGSYQLHGEFKSGEYATSDLLKGFTVDVAAAFAAGRMDL